MGGEGERSVVSAVPCTWTAAVAVSTDMWQLLLHTYCPSSSGETFSNVSTPPGVTLADEGSVPWGPVQETGHPATTHWNVTVPPSTAVALGGATMMEGVPRPLPSYA